MMQSRLFRAVTATMLAFGVTNSLPGLVAQAAGVSRARTTLGDWQLDIARDRFSGAVACRLSARNGHAFYRARAVAFRFRARRDVRNAVYRIDGGPPRDSRDDLPALVAMRVPLDRGTIDNSQQGIVWVPFDILRQGNSIAIQPGPGLRPRQYALRGLLALHGIAVERGCNPESRFVER